MFWDDYRPVEYAQEKTVPVAAYLSRFIDKPPEVQVSQSFHDGNLDVQWNRGVVFTAKQEGLWTTTPKVPQKTSGISATAWKSTRSGASCLN